MFRWSTTNIVWLLAYFAMLAAIIIGLRNYRATAIENYGRDNATENWLQWREAAEEIGKAGPVTRKAPKSLEPPALVLMRDHFAACLGISLLLTSCLFAWLMICARGAIRPVEIDYGNDD